MTSADIRAAAQREAERAYDDRADDMSECCPDVQYGFERGAVWAVECVTPTREQVRQVIVGGADWEYGFRNPDEIVEAMTDGILALMAGLAEGESGAGSNSI